ncbi:hypothetical protein DAEQUDRAFT_809894 [Daedalea quercina L-15889]|uniref:RRM domain-containing protein n=1 Tax=Daedalea quercina L-15889 TaxID=1314783 RepID=A0A165S693_9APHY|nr:hypothetical protein DAEQUDRAFT_809894 [Daedalea quercina L-15889]
MMAAESRVYLGKIPKDIHEEDLRKHLSIFGPITDMTLRTGYAIVNFELEKDALDVVSVLGKRRLLGADLQASLYIPRAKLRAIDNTPERVPRTRRISRDYSASVDSKNTIVITYLNKETCWQQLKDFARAAGRVVYCETNKKNKRVGFVKYETRKDADNAVKELNGRELMNCRVRVLSLEDYDRICEVEILRAGRMRSRSPEQRSITTMRGSPVACRMKHDGGNDVRGKSPEGRSTSKLEGGKTGLGQPLDLVTSERAERVIQVETEEPGELTEAGKKEDVPPYRVAEASPHGCTLIVIE